MFGQRSDGTGFGEKGLTGLGRFELNDEKF